MQKTRVQKSHATVPLRGCDAARALSVRRLNLTRFRHRQRSRTGKDRNNDPKKRRGFKMNKDLELSRTQRKGQKVKNDPKK